MAYTAVPSEYVSRRTVTNPRCVQPGGINLGTCSYDRRAFNVVKSGTLLKRIDNVRREMPKACKLDTLCVPSAWRGIWRGGKGPEGREYRECTDADRKTRILGNVKCAYNTLEAIPSTYDLPPKFAAP